MHKKAAVEEVEGYFCMYVIHAFQRSGRVKEEEEEFTVFSVRMRRWAREYVRTGGGGAGCASRFGHHRQADQWLRCRLTQEDNYIPGLTRTASSSSKESRVFPTAE